MAAATANIMCSICFETVVEDGPRGIAILRCSHQFHLDCVGAAFNCVGMMQCPNCRDIDGGNWRLFKGNVNGQAFLPLAAPRNANGHGPLFPLAAPGSANGQAFFPLGALETMNGHTPNSHPRRFYNQFPAGAVTENGTPLQHEQERASNGIGAAPYVAANGVGPNHHGDSSSEDSDDTLDILV